MILTKDWEKRLAALKKTSEALPVSPDDLLKMVKGELPPSGDFPMYVVKLEAASRPQRDAMDRLTPIFRYRIVYTMEHQPHFGLVRHCSISFARDDYKTAGYQVAISELELCDDFTSITGALGFGTDIMSLQGTSVIGRFSTWWESTKPGQAFNIFETVKALEEIYVRP
jgi:hypothetical protein